VARNRESVSRVAVSIALTAAAVAVVILGTGGFRTTVLGWRVSAHDPLRAATVAAASFLLAMAVVGRRRALDIANDYLTAWSRVLRPVQTIAVAVARIFDRYGIAIAGAALACLAALAVTAARDKPFWHDEVFTVLISQMPFATMYRAAADGIDLAPPLNTALTRVVHSVGGVGPVATRLAPIASFLAASTLIFLIVRRRAGTLAALTAALLPAATKSWQYAYEARGYALTMACFAAALHGWFEAAAGRRVRLNLVILALALAGGLWTHYYFVLAFIPVVLGEAVRQAAQRRVDIRPWTAIVLAGLIALPLWPLVRASSAQRATFWARPDADSPLVTRSQALYHSLFDTPEQPLLATTARVVAALIAVELVRRALRGVWPTRLPAHQLAALGACLLLPVAGLLLGDYSGVFTERYVLFTIVGVVLALVLGLSWLAPPSGLAQIAAVVGVLAASVHLGSRILSDRERPLTQVERRPLLVDRLVRFPDPIVITGGVDYLEIWYYMPATVKPRALYLGDPDGELRENRADSVSRGFSALARWTPLPVMPIDEFVASHPRFWMYSSVPNWIERSLTRRGATLIEHDRDRHNAGTLYEVWMNK
jgi:Dolichyl-phosphate-mannose-protein mannosyltransferase